MNPRFEVPPVSRHWKEGFNSPKLAGPSARVFNCSEKWRSSEDFKCVGKLLVQLTSVKSMSECTRQCADKQCVCLPFYSHGSTKVCDLFGSVTKLSRQGGYMTKYRLQVFSRVSGRATCEGNRLKVIWTDSADICGAYCTEHDSCSCFTIKKSGSRISCNLINGIIHTRVSSASPARHIPKSYKKTSN